MFLRVADIAPSEVHHLFSSDQRLREEIARNRRTGRCHNGNGAAQPCVDLVSRTTSRGVSQCPGK